MLSTQQQKGVIHMAVKIRINTKSKIQPQGKTTGILCEIQPTTSVNIDGEEYNRYKASFKTKEDNKVSINLVVDVTNENTTFMKFLELLEVQVLADADGEAELDFENAFTKEVGLEIEHTVGKSIVFANITEIFPLEA